MLSFPVLSNTWILYSEMVPAFCGEGGRQVSRIRLLLQLGGGAASGSISPNDSIIPSSSSQEGSGKNVPVRNRGHLGILVTLALSLKLPEREVSSKVRTR